MLSIHAKRRWCLPLYTLQEEIASEALRIHDLTKLAAYHIVLNVIDNAFLERPDAPRAEVKRWLKVTSANCVEAEIVSAACRKVQALQ